MTQPTRAEMEQAIILARLFASSPDISFSVITSDGPKTYSRAQIIQEVEQMSDFGLKYIEDQLTYTRNLASGKVLEWLEEIDNL